ncbi:hypothetical protein CF326_g7082, partial [Tilletia indica]
MSARASAKKTANDALESVNKATDGSVDSAKKAAGDVQDKAEDLKQNFIGSVDRTLGEKLSRAPAAAPIEETKEADQDTPATSTSVGFCLAHPRSALFLCSIRCSTIREGAED